MTKQQELIPMATGEYLKQERVKQKLSLAVVAKTIGLDEKLLREIEQDQANHVAPVYRNGYIQVYARYLRIPDEDIRVLVAPSGIQGPAIRNIFTEPPRRNPLDKWLRVTSYVMASLLIGTLAWQFTHEAVRLSQNGSQLQSAENRETDPENMAGQNQVQKLGGTVNASIAPLGSLHENRVNGLDTAEQAWAAVSRPVLPDGESQLQISVSADSWVEIIDASGQELEMDLLRGGTDKAYHGKPPFKILFGRASAVRLAMDDEPVDLSAYTQDDVAQLTWPQKTGADQK